MADKFIHIEKELLLRVAQGEEQAFRELFDAYRQPIYALGFYLTHHDFFAEEIVQEVFMRIWTNRLKLVEVTYFRAYVKTITRHVAFDHLKKLAAEKLALGEMAGRPEHSGIADDMVTLRAYERFFKEAIETLSPQRRKAYLLSRYLGLKQEDIAKQMQISVFTVKEHLKLASRQVRQYMDVRIEMTVAIAMTVVKYVV